jgi:uncharacterized membrane protein YfcA
MTDNPNLLLLSLGFFLIAALYSSVGFGGGSSYLALLALCIPDFLQIKTAALLCNLVVVSTGSYLYWKEGFFDRKKFFPLALCSVPAAFLGATLHLTQKSFFIFLGWVLALSGILLITQLFIKAAEKPVVSNRSWVINIGLGTSTGFLSGLVGIGGGILLSPILNLLKWDAAKKIAALASFFILVNSVAGLLGQVAGGNFSVQFPLLLMLLLAVFLGGQLGTRLSLRLLKPAIVRGLTGVLVSYIGVKLVLKYTLKIDI